MTELEREKQRQLSPKFLPFLTDYVELYLHGLKNELARANSPRRNWKAVLITRLCPTLKDLVADLQADSTSQFDYFEQDFWTAWDKHLSMFDRATMSFMSF